MAAGGFSYANYLNQNPDDVAAMAGGFPRPAPAAAPQPAANADQYAMLDEMVRAQQPAQPQPAPVAAPAAEPPAVPARAPLAAPETRSPRKAIAELQGQELARQNEVTASIGREGDAKVKATEDRAEVMKGAEGAAKRYVDAAQKNADDNAILQGEAKQWLADDMRKLREPPLEKTGWQKAVSALTGVLGMGLQQWLGGGVGGGLAFGLQAIDDHVSRNIREQLEEQDRAEANSERTTKYLDTLGRDSANELDLGAKMVANHYLATSKELERMAEEAKVPEIKEYYTRLSIESEQKASDKLMGTYERQLAEQRAAAAARAKALGAGPDWKNMDPTVLEALEREGKLPLAGLDALNDSRKRARDAQPEQPSAEAAAKLVAPEGRDVANPELWAATPDTEKVKYRASQAALDKYNRNSNRLQALLKKHGTQAFGEGAGEMDSLAKSLALDIKDITDAGALDAGLIDVVNSMHGDPNAIFTGGGNVLERLRTAQAQLNSGQEAKAMQLGLGARRETRAAPSGPGAPSASQPQAPQAPAAPKAPALVRMVRDADGKVISVPANRVGAARNSGFRLPDEMSRAEANAPQAADEAENARIQQALASVGG